MATLKAGTYTIKAKFTPPSKTLTGIRDYKYYPLTTNDTYGAASSSMGYVYVYDDSITLGGNPMYDSFVYGNPTGTWNYQDATEWDDDGNATNSVTYTATDTTKLRTIILETDQTVDDAFFTWFMANIEVPRLSVDLTTLSGWASLASGAHNIQIVAKASGYRDSEKSEAVQVTKPYKLTTYISTSKYASSSAYVKLNGVALNNGDVVNLKNGDVIVAFSPGYTDAGGYHYNYMSGRLSVDAAGGGTFSGETKTIGITNSDIYIGVGGGTSVGSSSQIQNCTITVNVNIT